MGITRAIFYSDIFNTTNDIFSATEELRGAAGLKGLDALEQQQLAIEQAVTFMREKNGNCRQYIW